MPIWYHIIIAIVLLVTLPLMIIKAAVNPAFRKDMAHWLDNWKSTPFLTDCIWIHASSAGEVRVAKTLIQNLEKGGGEERPIILSTFTLTGYELAKSEGSLRVFRLPPDLEFFIRPLLERLDPSLLILVESELWPSLLHLCKERKVSVLLLNGRMSKKTFRRNKFIRPIFQWLTEGITAFAMRSQLDADRIIKLGTSKERVMVTGNMKFDAMALPETEFRRNNEKMQMVVFVSTRPGDEGPILEAIARLKKEFPDAKYVLAPRHLQRLNEIKNLIAERGLEFTLHSALSPDEGNSFPNLILIDEMGIMDQYYAKAHIAFVGGGFSPEFGGHNILEPALYSLPVVFGQHMNNFQEEARLLVASGGGLQISAPEELFPILQRLLTHKDEMQERGAAALQTMIENQGATKKNIELIHKTLAAANNKKTLRA